MLWNKIPTENMREEIIDEICRKFSFVRNQIIGESVCGRAINALSIGNAETGVLWVSAHHGLEWLTTLLVLKFLNDICEKINNNEEICSINIKKSFEQRGLVIVPCLNPDGVEIAVNGFKSSVKSSPMLALMDETLSKVWQSNANGVDLNHNYDAGWDELHNLEISHGITGPSHTRYGGESPESEPETHALATFCRKNNFEYAIAFHSQGEEIYWNYGKHTPKSSERFAKIFALMSGYSVSHPEGLAVGGGFKDWFIEKFRKPAYTVEIGNGENPLPVESFEDIYAKIKNALYMSALT